MKKLLIIIYLFLTLALVSNDISLSITPQRRIYNRNEAVIIGVDITNNSTNTWFFPVLEGITITVLDSKGEKVQRRNDRPIASRLNMGAFEYVYFPGGIIYSYQINVTDQYLLKKGIYKVKMNISVNENFNKSFLSCTDTCQSCFGLDFQAYWAKYFWHGTLNSNEITIIVF